MEANERPISMRAIKDYCQAHGWSVLDKGAKGTVLFISPSDPAGKRMKIFVDNTPLVYLRSSQIQDLMVAIGVSEGRESSEVVRSILSSGNNPELLEQFAFRVHISEGEMLGVSPSLRLAEIGDVVVRIKNLLSYSISSEVEAPEPWRQRPLRTAAALADAFEFGHTERGSFVLHVRAPGRLYKQVSFLDRQPEAEERALARIASGLQWIRNHSVESIDDLSPTVIKDGLNANIAEQLFELSSALGARDVEVTFSFPSKAVRDLGVTPGPFPIDGKTRQRLRQFADILTAPQVFEGDISAKIIKAVAEPGEDAHAGLFHEVIMMTLDTPGTNFLFWDKKLRHSIASENEYRTAYERMATGKPIVLSGRFKYERGYLKAETLRIVW